MNDGLEKKVRWCVIQKKGVNLIEPNNILCEAYLKKARSSLRSMHINFNAKIGDWAVDTAYYARYQAVYALLQKCGIKSEIHDCSIALFHLLFEDSFSAELFEELEEAKEQRINLTYYTDRLVPKEEIEKNIQKTPLFLLKVEECITKISPKEIQRSRERVQQILIS